MREGSVSRDRGGVGWREGFGGVGTYGVGEAASVATQLVDLGLLVLSIKWLDVLDLDEQRSGLGGKAGRGQFYDRARGRSQTTGSERWTDCIPELLHIEQVTHTDHLISVMPDARVEVDQLAGSVAGEYQGGGASTDPKSCQSGLDSAADELANSVNQADSE